MPCNISDLSIIKQRFVKKVLPKSAEIIFKIFIISNTISNREIHDHTVIDPNIIVTTLTYVFTWLLAECEITYGSLSFMRDVFVHSTRTVDSCACVYTHCVLVFCITKILCSLACMCRFTKILLKIPRECIVGCSLATGAIHVANEIKMHNASITLPSFVLSAFFALFFLHSKALFVILVVAVTVSNHLVVACMQKHEPLFFERLRCNSWDVLWPVHYFDFESVRARSLTCSFFSAFAIFLFNGIEIELERENNEDISGGRHKEQDSGVVADIASMTYNGPPALPANEVISSGLPDNAHVTYPNAIQSSISRTRPPTVLCTSKLYRENKHSFINLFTFFLPFTIKHERKQFYAVERVFISVLTLNMAVLLLLFRLFIPKIVYIGLSMFLGVYIIIMSLKEVRNFSIIERITIVCLGIFNTMYNMFVLSVMLLTGAIYLVSYMRNSNTRCQSVDNSYSHIVYEYEMLDANVKGEIVVIDLRRYNYIISNERERIGNLVKRLRVKNIFVMKRKNLFIRLENVNFICELSDIWEYLV